LIHEDQASSSPSCLACQKIALSKIKKGGKEKKKEKLKRNDKKFFSKKAERPNAYLSDLLPG